MKEINSNILSDITVHMKYAKYIPELQRRETWEELVDRNMAMHIKKYPELEVEIRKAYSYVFTKQILPSMRSLQFAGKPIEISPNRLYNCSYLPVDSLDAFNEIMFLLVSFIIFFFFYMLLSKNLQMVDMQHGYFYFVLYMFLNQKEHQDKILY